MEQQELLGAEAGEEVEARRQARRATRAAADQQAKPRVVEARRDQLEMRPMDLESLLPAQHRARALWEVVSALDLSRFYAPIKARGSTAGRAATDPKVLLALWLYATAEGVAHAREVERLCHVHDVYRWLRGGVPVNYHTLSDFRVEHGAALDELLSQLLAGLLAAQVVTLRRVTQDGTRIRAWAGSRSFRREERLREQWEAAQTQVRELAAQAQQPAPAGMAAGPARQRRARERAAAERAARVAQALAAVEAVRAERAASKPGSNDPQTPPRGSTTDPEARKMRMSDGGYRPAYNVQFATDTAHGVIVGVDVSQRRTDFGAAAPMMDQVRQRLGRPPEELLVDTGYTSREAVEELSRAGVTLYGALPERQGKPDPYAAQRGDSVAMTALKERMRSDEGRAAYAQRAPVAERVNADLKSWRTLDRVPVRGRAKVLCVVLWNVLAFNILRALAVLPSAAG